MDTPLIETRNLKKYFKTGRGMLHAVDDVNFKIAKGETLGVVGESGCGKSTLGRVMIRLLDATEGQVLYNGQDIMKYGKSHMNSLRKDLQIIFQDPYASLNPRMSVSEIIGNTWTKLYIGQDLLRKVLLFLLPHPLSMPLT